MKSPAFAIVIALLSATLVAGCGSAPQTPPKAVAADPNIKESISAAPAFDVGHTVHITATGLRPQSLASLCCAPIVFKNETSQTISVVFFIYKIESGPIAPGASWQWVPNNPQSLGYHLGGDPNQTGHIQVESPDW